MFPSARDEGRHDPGPDPGWEESWQFDAAAPDASLGVSVRLGLRGGRGWWWTSVAGARRDLVAVRDHDVDPPRGAALELRGSGLWAELTCETPLDHWSAGLEAFGVAFDEPMEAYGAERGQPVAVGLDLEWEATGPPCPAVNGGGYGQPCAVHGEVLVGAERIQVDAFGARSHFWGARNWWDEPWWQVHGRLEDGPAFWAVGGGGDVTAGRGAWYSGEEPEAAQSTATLELVDGDGALPRRLGLTLADTTMVLTVVAHAPVVVPGPLRPGPAVPSGPAGRGSRFWRGLVHVKAGDGRRGVGWCERLALPG